jgi:hypothetical protein
MNENKNLFLSQAEVQQLNITRLDELEKWRIMALMGTPPFNCSGVCLGPNNTDKYVSN